MKILVMFIDMVRVTELNLYDDSKKKTLLDNRLKSLGGRLFTRCYTPSPDTPRSNACMQTGLYPYYNGCDTRIKWPRFFVKDEITTIFDHAVERGFEVNHCVRTNTYETGLLKFAPSPKIHSFNDHYELFFSEKNFVDDSFSFVYTPDWHIAVTDYSSTYRGFKKGDQMVDKLIEKYFTQDFVDIFDYIVIYSDHGFQYGKEGALMKSKLELLNDSRNRILMFIHKKGDVGIQIDNRLASIVDLYATMEQLIGAKDFRQGFSLLDLPQREITHIEDHQDFSVSPEVMIKQWRVISNNFDIRTDIYKTIDNKGTVVDINLIDGYLREFSPNYSAYVKQLSIWKSYAVLSKEESECYMVGEKRPSRRFIAVYKMFQKSIRLFISLVQSMK